VQTPDETTPDAVKSAKSFISRENLTLGLAAFAAILALGPYVLPQVSVYFVRQGLVKHPELLAEASKAYDAQQMEKQRIEFEKSIKANLNALITPEDPVLGDPKAAITVVEFQDYFCGYCRMMAPEIEKILAENKDVRFVIKELPVISPNSRGLAAMALASVKTGKYAGLHHELYAAHLQSEQDIVNAFAKAGLDAGKLMSEGQDPAIQSQIDKSLILGQRLNFNATPMFIINGEVVAGARVEELHEKIAKARAGLKGK
jgi:protein-disulfide isomerase